ncbi:alpha/beta hydrolase fold domain-containing protein [Dyadobacter bucti]|uniref:alpha/beta hydrolase fold domain-containing protein n=1 Tax=Dyadobacter bucti TaxID=2572203 RepID=UPI0011085095|nr:alpha/beta hydrolase fold domain-containing protein [Dyadobacter bucti]
MALDKINTEPFDISTVTRSSKMVYNDGYDLSITVIKPNLAGHEKFEFPVFLFIASTGECQLSIENQDHIVSQIVNRSRQAAVILNSPAISAEQLPVFEWFAAMKWIAYCGTELGLDGRRIALVGHELGANVVAILSIMALADNFPNIRLQVMIDTQFFLSQRLKKPNRGRCRTVPEHMRQEWVDMESVYNLPLQSMMSELSGLPPTIIEQSLNMESFYELGYYCSKLVGAGNSVTCVNFEECNKEQCNNGIPYLSQKLVAHTAYELMKCQKAQY